MSKQLLAALGAAMMLAAGEAPASGRLVFEKKLVEVRAAPDAEIVTVEFPFTVRGDGPVTIAEYDASCSCLEAQISSGGKLTWKPGEQGVVKGIFKMGTFKGTVEKPIVLRMKGNPAWHKLTVRVHVPVLFQIEPPTLFWDEGGDAATKKFRMKVNHDKPIHVTEVSGTNQQFDYELKTIRDGWEYALLVTPKTVERRAFGLMRVRTDAEFKRHRSYQGFVVVRRPRPGAG